MDSPQPGYDLACQTCGAGVRPIDRYCSQCGRRDPAGREQQTTDDPLLTSPTQVTVGEDATQLPSNEAFGTFVTREGLTEKQAMRTARRARTRDQALALEMMLQPGLVFGRRYRIQRFLGSGAMGYVCSAVDESIDEVVALKILSSPIHEEPESFERFKNELKLARRIRHRNVVQSFDLGFSDGYPFISMEYIDADNLLKHLARGTHYDETAALSILRQVLRGLRAAHDLGIVHRDIKPENILVNKDRLAFITDFGIATTANFQRRREIAGTPDYMAPEQLRGEAVSPASDFYSCGVMLYRMLAGTLPFKANTLNQIIEAHLRVRPEPLPSDLPVSDETREVIEWMLQKKMSDRPQTALALLEKIDPLLRTGRTRSASRLMTVLIVEHDPEALAFLRGVLELEGYRVVATGNAREGVNLAFEQAPSLIFLDAKIRGGFEIPHELDEIDAADGLGFMRIVRGDEKLRGVPIVLMTEETLSSLDTHFERLGVADVVLKPLEKVDVIEAMKLVGTAPV